MEHDSFKNEFVCLIENRPAGELFAGAGR